MMNKLLYDGSELVVLKPNAHWRLYQLELKNGAWRNLSVRNAGELKHYLLLYQPVNVYESVNEFLCPLRMQKESSVMLRQFYFFDLDYKDYAFAKKIDGFMRRRGHEPVFAEQPVDSGNGLHLYYHERVNTKLDADYRKRKDDYAKNRKAYKDELLKEGIVCDWQCLTNPLCVSRVIGTYNDGNKRKQCRFAPRAGKTAMTNPPHRNAPEAEPHSGLRVRASITMKAKFVTTKVYGTKRNVLFFQIPKRWRAAAFCSRAQEECGLGTFYAISYGDVTGLLCADALDQERCKKVYARYDFLNRNKALKHNFLYLRVSETLKDGNAVEPAPEVFAAFPSPTRNVMSLYHAYVLSRMENTKTVRAQLAKELAGRRSSGKQSDETITTEFEATR